MAKVAALYSHSDGERKKKGKKMWDSKEKEDSLYLKVQGRVRGKLGEGG